MSPTINLTVRELHAGVCDYNGQACDEILDPKKIFMMSSGSDKDKVTVFLAGQAHSKS